MTPEGKACRQLIREALIKYDLPDSGAAVRLLEMIAAHESGGFTYSRQLGGPALSLFQIEPVTYRDLCDYASSRELAICSEFPRNPMRLVFDPCFAAGMARVFFPALSGTVAGRRQHHCTGRVRQIQMEH